MGALTSVWYNFLDDGYSRDREQSDRNANGKRERIMNVRNRVIVIAASAMAACASEPTGPVPTLLDEEQVVRDFIDVRGLEEVDRIRGAERRSYEKVTPSYIIFKPRRGDFLVEFVRPCNEIWNNTYLSADDTFLHNTLRAKFDKIRGCRIGRIFALTESDLLDLKQR
ncbi:MAG: hypothetical protein QNL45_04895 [Nitrospirota bacterium]|nr:hypothetical protein [Nitrospirota bacterium]